MEGACQKSKTKKEEENNTWFLAVRVEGACQSRTRKKKRRKTWFPAVPQFLHSSRKCSRYSKSSPRVRGLGLGFKGSDEPYRYEPYRYEPYRYELYRWVQGSGFRVEGSRLGLGLGLRLGFRGFRVRVQGSGFRVQG